MPDVTYVSFVPAAKRDKLRRALTTEDTGRLHWMEKRGLFGSEFHFSGPPALVRKTHAFITAWVASDQ